MGRGKTHILAMLAIGTAAYVITPASAQHGEEGHHENDSGEFVMPASYADAIHVLHEQLEKIESLIGSGRLDRVHAEAAVIRDVAKGLARLALDRESGIPRAAIRDINLTARELAAMFEPIDEAGDSGNLSGTQTVFEEMVALFESLEEHVLKFTVEVDSVSDSIQPGEETTLIIQIKDPAGELVRNLKVVHENVLHLLMVSEDLSWYAHEHPAAQSDGSLVLDFTFPSPGKYVLFHDFTPAHAGMQVVPVELTITGTPSARLPLRADHHYEKVVDDYLITLTMSGSLVEGNEVLLAYGIRRGNNPVLDLEPYLGAMGHLVFISEDLTHFVHSHPLGEHHGEDAHQEEDERNEHREHGGVASGATSSVVSFHAEFPTAGLYKGWAQFKHQGRVITVPFVLEVDADEHHEDREPNRGRAHDDH